MIYSSFFSMAPPPALKIMKLLKVSFIAFNILPNAVYASVESPHLYPTSLIAPSTPSHPQIETSSLLSLHRSLISIPSESSHEANIILFLTEYLRSINYTVSLLPLSPPESGRSSILVHPLTLPNYSPTRQNFKTRILLTTHIDTVPPFIPYSFTPHPTDPSLSLIRGRGSVDAYASLVSQLAAVHSLLTHLQPGDLSLLFVPGEETTGIGMRSFSRLTCASRLNLTYETIIFGEPTDNNLATGHKGLHLFDLHAHGRAAHSGYPSLGVSATRLVLEGLQALENLEMPYSERFGNSTINIGRIEGGVAANVVAAEATAECSVRLAGGTIAQLKMLVKKAIGELEIEKGGAMSVETVLEGYSPVVCDTDVDGFETASMNYGTDIPHLSGHRGKKYLYGPGSILVAHGEEEGLTVGELEQGVSGYRKLILHSLWMNSLDEETGTRLDFEL